MPNNPRFAMLMENYAKFDTVTLALAGLALAAVLVGWLFQAAGGRSIRMLHAPTYYALMALGWLGVMVGTLYILLAQP